MVVNGRWISFVARVGVGLALGLWPVAADLWRCAPVTSNAIFVIEST
jgi:hypothetical protein